MRTLPLFLVGAMGLGLAVQPVFGKETSQAGLREASAKGAADFPPGTFFTVDILNRLDHFNVAVPGQLLGSVVITGVAAGEEILGIDFRPANGRLYGLGSTSQLYLIDAVTGVASPVGGPFTPALNGGNFGFDFNPLADRIRVVSNNEQNLRLNPDTGAVAVVDNALNPAGTVVASAYTNNFAGTTSTTLYGIDSGSNQLVIQNPPNDGAVSVVGPLGVDAADTLGFDIAAETGVAYAAMFTGSLPSNLFTINLATGAATLVGGIATGSGSAVRSMAVVTGAETVYGVTTSNKLVSFRSSAPAAIIDTVPITGLQAGENVLGIDVRPATGELYGLGSTSRIYRIDTFTAAATSVGAGPFTPALAGTDFGFDFNPTVDRIRIVSDAEQNLRAHPDLGTIAFTDSNLTPAGNVVAAAYANNFAGATSTTLFDIDSNSDLLLTQNPPNIGQLNAVGPLGVDATGLTGFDIAPNGAAFASITLQGAASTSFYRINLATGALLSLGTIGGGEPIRDMAVRIGSTEVVYGLTQAAGPTNSLVRFNAATPGTIISAVPITGLQVGEALLGIDFRPATGQLFALGNTSRLYTLNRATGVATQVGTGQFSELLNGSNFGFDFNPTVDLIRVVSENEQNLRLNPNTGAVATVDAFLNPAGGVVAAAYINNFAGALSTTLYDIDWLTDRLVIQNPPNNGTLVLVGSLGIVTSSPSVGFDIASGSGNAYASAYSGGATPGFYRVNLGTGAVTLIGNVNVLDLLVDVSVLLEREPLIFRDGFE